MMMSRLQTSRALLNVQPLVLKQQTSVSSSDGEQQSGTSGTASSGSLSPSIQSDMSSLLMTTNETMDVQPDNQRKYFELGDYLLFEEPQCQQAAAAAANGSNNDVYGSALHLTSKQVFYWKKFHQRDYMKKLEPYFIMDGCSDNVYKFSEIIHESNFNDTATATTAAAAGEYVYVFFKPHYGDLHSYMKEKKRLSESEARSIFRQCVEAVRACHENNIIIRDIKLKKFVFLDAAKTKIGLANLQDCLLLDEDAENDLIKSQQGCPAYVSPEVLNPLQTYYSGKLSDSWSLGIILYTLLVGRYPFHHPTIANMFARISRGKFHVPTSISLSLDARTLLRALIRIKADERLLPHEILEHNWFRQNERDENVARLMHLQSAAAAAAVAYNHHNGSLLNELKLMNKIHVGISLSSSSSSSAGSSPRVVNFLTSSSNSTCALSNTNTNNTSNHLTLALNSKTNNSNGTVNDDCIVPSSSTTSSSSKN